MHRWFAGFAVSVLVLYGAANVFGWSFGSPRKGHVIPKNVRQKPGGYRSYVYWRGGK